MKDPSRYRLGGDGDFRLHGTTYVIINEKRRSWGVDGSILTWIPFGSQKLGKRSVRYSKKQKDWRTAANSGSRLGRVNRMHLPEWVGPTRARTQLLDPEATADSRKV